MPTPEDDDTVDDGGEDKSKQRIDWKARYQNQKDRTHKALSRVGELENLLSEAEPKAATHETLNKRVKELEAERDAERSGRAFDRAVTGKGITDPEAVDLVQLQYNRLPEKDRPKPDAWLDSLTKEAGKEPKWLAPYLPAKQQGQQQGQHSGGQGGQQQGQTGQGQLPNPTNGVVGGGSGTGSGAPTQAEILSARQAALAGNHEPWNAVQARMGFQPLPKFGG